MEVVVLDNASHDGSIEMLRDEFPGVIVMAEDTRRGFGANQNRAIAASRGDLVFMLNPDAVVVAGTIDALVQALWRDKRVVAAGCRTLNSDGTVRQERPIPFPTPLSIYSKAVGLGRFVRKRRSPTDVFGDRWLGGGAMLIDRQTFLEIGGFDESFFMYSEDVDLCRRLRATGYLFAWAPHASVVHPFPEESTPMSRRRQYEIVQAELSYMRKYYGRIGRHVYRFGAAPRCSRGD
jgi:GT2 family glycosyltransferase